MNLSGYVADAAIIGMKNLILLVLSGKEIWLEFE